MKSKLSLRDKILSDVGSSVQIDRLVSDTILGIDKYHTNGTRQDLGKPLKLCQDQDVHFAGLVDALCPNMGGTKRAAYRTGIDLYTVGIVRDIPLLESSAIMRLFKTPQEYGVLEQIGERFEPGRTFERSYEGISLLQSGSNFGRLLSITDVHKRDGVILGNISERRIMAYGCARSWLSSSDYSGDALDCVKSNPISLRHSIGQVLDGVELDWDSVSLVYAPRLRNEIIKDISEERRGVRDDLTPLKRDIDVRSTLLTYRI